MDALTRYLADVATMRGFVQQPVEEMHEDAYDAAENRGMESPYGYDPGEHFIVVHVTD